MNMCTGVRKKEKRVCQILSPQDMWFPHLDTHSQLPAAGSVSAPRLQLRLHFPLFAEKRWQLKEKNVSFHWEWLCMKSFKQATSNPETKEGLSSPMGGVTMGELKHWNLVVGMNWQINEQGASEEGFFLLLLVFLAWALSECIRCWLSRVYHHFYKGNPIFTLRESQLSWLEDGNKLPNNHTSLRTC